MDWIERFYEQQAVLIGASQGVQDHHRTKVEVIARLAGPGRKRILELGAGRGENAAAAADLGHDVVAVELVPSLVVEAQTLAAGRESLRVLGGSFYVVEPPGPFDVVAYWDGFGVGEDEDQRLLLCRIAEWLAPGGCALVDVYNPLYAAQTVGRTNAFGEARRRYGFDPAACRWLDTFWREGAEDEAVTQSLRCYTPADLGMLLRGTGLRIDDYEIAGGYDWGTETWHDQADLHFAIWYTARLVRG